MKFRTIVDLPPERFVLSPDDRVLLSGSCFTSAIGRHLLDSMPYGHVMANPFGVLYNPYSIATTIEILLSRDSFPNHYIYKGVDGLWHSRLHSGDFSASSEEQCRALIEERFGAARRLLSAADVLVLTWGTSYVYALKEDGEIVGNCHKEPSSAFEVRRLRVEEIVTQYEALLRTLRDARPGLNVVLTVSPYRYVKYGLHENTLSKSVLHLAAEQLTERFDYVSYFPAYEIVNDELRDYRFFESDMAHPSAQASDYVWERFSQWCFTDELREYAADKKSLLDAVRHRPLHPDSEAYVKFRRALEEKKKRFNNKWNRPLHEEELSV